MDRADAFVFVIPEYNHSFNAAIKNALDYLHTEWAYKPVGFVSYGGVAAGTRALRRSSPWWPALRMTPVMEAVNIPFVGPVHRRRWSLRTQRAVVDRRRRHAGRAGQVGGRPSSATSATTG